LVFNRSVLFAAFLFFVAPPAVFIAQSSAPPATVFGYRDFAPQARWDAAFLAVPDAALAGQHLKILTAEPHWASSPEDYKTAQYVAAKFKAAGLQTEIVPYKVLLNKPVSILVEAFDAQGNKLMSGPTPEHVDPGDNGGDPYQDDPRILPAFNGSSPSGDVTAEVVYANYGTLADFKYLAAHNISVKGKIVLVRYGQNFRGVKVYIAQQYGAAGVLIYSDPADDGYFRGDTYPKGPYRPASAVQRGSTQFLPIYPGDPQTPGIASTPNLPDSKRIPFNKLQADQPSIPVNPLSYGDATPILKSLTGPNSPRDWQGALPFAYHIGGASGSGKVTVHMRLQQDYALRTIWDVIGRIPGTDPAQKNEIVLAGNHRDAWVYGAVDPSSGTAAMLESVHGLGDLLKQGWHPRRTIVIASWDAEEEGLIGSTEWAEQHAKDLTHAVAYFNTDVGVSGPNFTAAAVPSLKQFVRDVARDVPSPAGGTVYDQWKITQDTDTERRRNLLTNSTPRRERSRVDNDLQVGTLGSGSDYTPFFQHLGIPSTDIGSEGPYGVYHSVFDNFNWFVRNADPTFVYEQQMARVFGLEVLHMADADVLPYDYQLYGLEIASYITAAQRRASTAKLTLDFTPVLAASQRFTAAGTAIHVRQSDPPSNPAALNLALRSAEEAFLNPDGLPKRPWYKHTIFAPGEFTGYAAVVIPGVNEAIELPDVARAQTQLAALTAALNRAAAILESATK
jgi:N-acetylated-alpha-linked acidic dipeptidase